MNNKKAKALRRNVLKMKLNPNIGSGSILYKRFKKNYKKAPLNIRKKV